MVHTYDIRSILAYQLWAYSLQVVISEPLFSRRCEMVAGILVHLYSDGLRFTHAQCEKHNWR